MIVVFFYVVKSTETAFRLTVDKIAIVLITTVDQTAMVLRLTVDLVAMILRLTVDVIALTSRRRMLMSTHTRDRSYLTLFQLYKNQLILGHN